MSSGAAAKAVAARLAAFVSDVGEVGLSEALRRAGLSELVDKPVGEVLNGLLDRLGGPASLFDDVDARAALARLQEEYLAEAEDAAVVEQILLSRVADLENLLFQYFGFYLYELFCRVFYERLVQRVGETRADSYLDEIEEFIKSSLANRTCQQDLSSIDWAGSEGGDLITEIMEATLNVFGG